MTNSTVSSATWIQLRDELRTRSQARAAAKSLRKDLSSFTSADLTDLDAFLEQQDPAETVDIRRILNRQHAA